MHIDRFFHPLKSPKKHERRKILNNWGVGVYYKQNTYHPGYPARRERGGYVPRHSYSGGAGWTVGRDQTSYSHSKGIGRWL